MSSATYSIGEHEDARLPLPRDFQPKKTLLLVYPLIDLAREYIVLKGYRLEVAYVQGCVHRIDLWRREQRSMFVF